MPTISKQQAIYIVEGMLREHLPATWHSHVKLEPYAAERLGGDVDLHDLAWLIKRPEDADTPLRYYRLQLLGNSCRSFLLVYGNTDIGVGPDYHHAIVFDEFRAPRVFERLVSRPSELPPNHYGFT